MGRTHPFLERLNRGPILCYGATGDRGLEEGLAIARELVEEICPRVQSAYIMALERYDLVGELIPHIRASTTAKVARVEEEIVIAKAGKPVSRLVSPDHGEKRPLGFVRASISFPAAVP